LSSTEGTLDTSSGKRHPTGTVTMSENDTEPSGLARLPGYTRYNSRIWKALAIFFYFNVGLIALSILWGILAGLGVVEEPEGDDDSVDADPEVDDEVAASDEADAGDDTGDSDDADADAGDGTDAEDEGSGDETDTDAGDGTDAEDEGSGDETDADDEPNLDDEDQRELAMAAISHVLTDQGYEIDETFTDEDYAFIAVDASGMTNDEQMELIGAIAGAYAGVAEDMDVEVLEYELLGPNFEQIAYGTIEHDDAVAFWNDEIDEYEYLERVFDGIE